MKEELTEILLIACSSKEYFSIFGLDTRTLSTIWSFKGNELQGATIGGVELLGPDQDLLLIHIKDRPIVHLVAVNSRDSFHVKSPLSNPLRHVNVVADGSVICGVVDTKISLWMTVTGDLASVADVHHCEITCIAMNVIGSILFCGFVDGWIKSFLLADLMTLRNKSLERVSPFYQWRNHSLAVKAIYPSKNCDSRVLSCSLDNTASLQSITLDQCILKISCDRPLTSCLINASESTLYLGSDNGVIARINVIDGPTRNELNVMMCGNTSSPMLRGHESQVTQLVINTDESLLASGDSAGVYCLWDIRSTQLLKSANGNGSICKLSFIINQPCFYQAQYRKVTVKTGTLQPQKSENDIINFPLTINRLCNDGEELVEEENFARNLDFLLKELITSDVDLLNCMGDETNNEMSEMPSDVSCMAESESKRNKDLLMEICKLKKLNQEMFSFFGSYANKG